LQLIEIVQLALFGFAVLILILFFASYLGYKARKKNEKSFTSNNSFHDQSNAGIEFNDHKEITIEDKKEIVESVTSNNKTQKFQVFNPNTSSSDKENIKNTKKHFPRTLYIKK
jgi:amino acid permease